MKYLCLFQKRKLMLVERQRIEADSVIQEVEDENTPPGSVDRG